jgi:hypothetical protein
MKRRHAAAFALALLASTGGCSSMNPSPTVQSLAVTGSAALAAAGATSQLTATAALSTNTTTDVTSSATWSSSDTTVATVSSGGLVNALKVGSVTVTATYQGKSGTLVVTIGASFAGLTGSSTWTGTWIDTRYNVSGTLQATFTINGTSVTATGVIGLQSLGLGNESGTGTGTISAARSPSRSRRPPWAAAPARSRATAPAAGAGR